jgi:hypothetical protein
MSLLLVTPPLLACAACYGQSDSPLAKGMNWGIVTLLGTVLLVLGGIAAFFVSLARRSAALAREAEAGAAVAEAGAADLGLPCRSAAVRGPGRAMLPRRAVARCGRLSRRHVRKALACAREASAAVSRFLCSRGGLGGHARTLRARQRPGSSSTNPLL